MCTNASVTTRALVPLLRESAIVLRDTTLHILHCMHSCSREHGTALWYAFQERFVGRRSYAMQGNKHTLNVFTMSQIGQRISRRIDGPANYYHA
jgi:hypothetical protein